MASLSAPFQSSDPFADNYINTAAKAKALFKPKAPKPVLFVEIFPDADYDQGFWQDWTTTDLHFGTPDKRDITVEVGDDIIARTADWFEISTADVLEAAKNDPRGEIGEYIQAAVLEEWRGR